MTSSRPPMQKRTARLLRNIGGSRCRHTTHDDSNGAVQRRSGDSGGKVAVHGHQNRVLAGEDNRRPLADNGAIGSDDGDLIPMFEELAGGRISKA